MPNEKIEQMVSELESDLDNNRDPEEAPDGEDPDPDREGEGKPEAAPLSDGKVSPDEAVALLERVDKATHRAIIVARARIVNAMQVENDPRALSIYSEALARLERVTTSMQERVASMGGGGHHVVEIRLVPGRPMSDANPDLLNDPLYKDGTYCAPEPKDDEPEPEPPQVALEEPTAPPVPEPEPEVEPKSKAKPSSDPWSRHDRMAKGKGGPFITWAERPEGTGIDLRPPTMAPPAPEEPPMAERRRGDVLVAPLKAEPGPVEPPEG